MRRLEGLNHQPVVEWRSERPKEGVVTHDVPTGALDIRVGGGRATGLSSIAPSHSLV